MGQSFSFNFSYFIYRILLRQQLLTFRQFFSSIICYFPVRRILQHDFKNMCSCSFGGNQLDSYNLQLCFKVIYWAFPCLQWLSLKWGAAEATKGLNAWSLYLGVIVIIVTFCFSFSWLLYTVHDTDLSFNGGHDFGSILYFRTLASFERTFAHSHQSLFSLTGICGRQNSFSHQPRDLFFASLIPILFPS